MAAPRFGNILDLDSHDTRFETPGPNAYSLADKNLEAQKKIKSSANFLVQKRPENIFDGILKNDNSLPGPGQYEVGSKESAVERSFSIQ